MLSEIYATPSAQRNDEVLSVFRNHAGSPVTVSRDFSDPHRVEQQRIDKPGLIVSDELVAGQSSDQATHFKDGERRQNSRSLYGCFAQKFIDVNRLRADQIENL